MKRLFKQYYDNDTDTFWVVFKSGIETRYEEMTPGFNVEFNKNSEVIGIEIQNFSRFYNFKSTGKDVERAENMYSFSDIPAGYPSLTTFKTDSFN